MSLSMKYLFTVALVAGLFEAASVFMIEQPWAAAAFAAVFLACAVALRLRQSIVATAVIGLFLLVDVGGVPFYTKDGVMDWVVQLAFGAVGVVGLVACVNVLRARRFRAVA
jgi:hypothetical protein